MDIQNALEQSGGKKAAVGARLIAGAIDAVAAFILMSVPALGGWASLAYWLLRDGVDLPLMDRRSLGKKVMNLRAMRLDGKKTGPRDSILRNWPFALGGLTRALLGMPILGWLLVLPVAAAALLLGLAEVYFIVTDPKGRRLGDRMAETIVVEVPY